MNAQSFYRQYLKDIAVPIEEIKAARTKRNQLAAVGIQVLERWALTPTGWGPAGALAAGTQIAPLSDVDLFVEGATLRAGWLENPQRALDDLCSAMGDQVRGRCETSAHAVKFTFEDEDFTADVVFGMTRTAGGLLIPHCPDDEPHDWINTHPRRHAELVRERNRATGNVFAQEIRILKGLNRRWRLAEERKVISSWHLTALGLAVLTEPFSFDTGTPYFLSRAAELVMRPLRDPARIGPDLVAADPELASRLLADAAAKTQQALQSGDNAEPILRAVFGDPKTLVGAVQGKPLTVGAAGLISIGGSGRGIGSSRDFGDDA